MEPRFHHLGTIRDIELLENINALCYTNSVIEVDLIWDEHINYATHQSDVNLHATARGVEFVQEDTIVLLLEAP